MSSLRGAWRAVRPVLLALAAIVLFIEEWGWRPLTAAAARVARWPPIARFENLLRRAPPKVALALFLVPALLLFPVKLAALWLIHEGRAMLGISLIVVAKLAGTALVGRLFAPDLFSGWGIRTLSTRHAAYHPIGYHRGTVWPVENATIVFGLRRFGFDVRALELSEALFDLAALYPDYRVPECVGGYARGEWPSPGAYPRANPAQLWNASGYAMVMQAILGLQPLAPLDMLIVDPVLPSWLPEVIVHDLRLAGATVTVRFWRDKAGASHVEVLRKRGTFHLIKQPPLESLSATPVDRFGALVDRVLHF